MNTTIENLTADEREAILTDYAESCRLRLIKHFPENSDYAINRASQWAKNCREDAIQSIRNGRDTWERIVKVAEEYRKEHQ
jgi:hypothetical protein